MFMAFKPPSQDCNQPLLFYQVSQLDVLDFCLPPWDHHMRPRELHELNQLDVPVVDRHPRMIQSNIIIMILNDFVG